MQRLKQSGSAESTNLATEFQRATLKLRRYIVCDVYETLARGVVGKTYFALKLCLEDSALARQQPIPAKLVEASCAWRRERQQQWPQVHVQRMHKIEPNDRLQHGNANIIAFAASRSVFRPLFLTQTQCTMHIRPAERLTRPRTDLPCSQCY